MRTARWTWFGFRQVAALCAVTWLLMPCCDTANAQRFQFGAIGDTGYSKRSEAEFDRMLAAMNKEPLEFVAHVGDFEADPRPFARNPSAISMPCTDAHYRRVLAQFANSEHPLVLTPGDNDWTDCHLLKAQTFDPLERLSALRELFYPAGRSLGKRTMAVRSQTGDPLHGKFRENLAWSINRVEFVTLHIVGSNDNKGRTPQMDAEAGERTAANIAWMRKAFAQARTGDALGLVLITQANPGFETQWTPSLKDRYFRIFPGVEPPKETRPGGFDDILDALAVEMESFAKPVLFVHGDTHIFHVSKPLLSNKSRRFFENFTRVEVFGDPESHWVRVTVDPMKPALFLVEPEIVPDNVTR